MRSPGGPAHVAADAVGPEVGVAAIRLVAAAAAVSRVVAAAAVCDDDGTVDAVHAGVVAVGVVAAEGEGAAATAAAAADRHRVAVHPLTRTMLPGGKEY